MSSSDKSDDVSPSPKRSKLVTSSDESSSSAISHTTTEHNTSSSSEESTDTSDSDYNPPTDEPLPILKLDNVANKELQSVNFEGTLYSIQIIGLNWGDIRTLNKDSKAYIHKIIGKRGNISSPHSQEKEYHFQQILKRLRTYEEREHLYHNGNGKAWMQAVLQLLLFDKCEDLFIDRTSGKTHHEVGYSKIKVKYDDEDAPTESNTTDCFVQCDNDFLVVVEIKSDTKDRKKYFQQLTKQVVGLWNTSRKYIIGILLMEGIAIIYVYEKQETPAEIIIHESQQYQLGNREKGLFLKKLRVVYDICNRPSQ